MKTALITGITGQDGSYLAELLVDKGYAVYGVVRRSSVPNLERISHLKDSIVLCKGDLSDANSLLSILDEARPDEVYNLGAMSHVRDSFKIPAYTADITGTGVIRLLEAIRHRGPSVRYYQASSSEMFGSASPPQNEFTRFQPRSPYGCAKVFSYYATVNYRESYGMHASNGILFNHESPRRGINFVTRKITLAAARIKRGLQKVLFLGNLDARRDWGFARDFCEAQWLLLQQPEPDDYVIATGETHSVKEFLEVVFRHHNLFWEDYVRIDPTLYRPAEVDCLLGDASKAKRKLGWTPKIRFRELAIMMAEADLKLVTDSPGLC